MINSLIFFVFWFVNSYFSTIFTKLSQILLGIRITIGCGTAEAFDGLLLLTAEPVSNAQGVQSPFVVANRLQQTQGLVMAVAAIGSEQLAGLVDDLGSLVRHIIIIDTYVT